MSKFHVTNVPSRIGAAAQAPEELEVAPRGAAAELAGLTGVWAAVKYLVAVGSQHMDLIQAHAQCAPRQQATLLLAVAAFAREARKCVQHAL